MLIKQTEHQLQCQCVNWFRLQYPQQLIIAIPNGGIRNIATAVKLKKEGVLAGVPDLFIPHLRMFVELKVGKNKLTPSQVIIQEKLKDFKYHVFTCYTFNEFSDLVKHAEVGMREYNAIKESC